MGEREGQREIWRNGDGSFQLLEDTHVNIKKFNELQVRWTQETCSETHYSQFQRAKTEETLSDTRYSQSKGKDRGDPQRHTLQSVKGQRQRRPAARHATVSFKGQRQSPGHSRREVSPHTRGPQLDILIMFLAKPFKTRDNGQMHSECWKGKPCWPGSPGSSRTVLQK